MYSSGYRQKLTKTGKERPALDRVKLFHRQHRDETISRPDKAVLMGPRKRPETIASYCLGLEAKQRGRVMSALFSLLYREYCLVRLLEMRRYHR